MRKSLGSIICVIGILAFVFVSSALPQQKEGSPDIELVESVHNLGEIFEQPLYEYSFKVRNKGTADLEIKNVKPG